MGRGGRQETIVVGFAIGGDSRRLEHNGISLEEGRIIDLQPWLSRQADGKPGLSISLSNASFKHFGKHMGKEARLSDWEGPLSHAQLRYAATDAWATMRLFSLAPAEACTP